jgi:hypothetical protein
MGQASLKGSEDEQLTLTPISGFTGRVSLTCSSVPTLPIEYRCNINPTSVTLSGGTQKAAVTVNTVSGFPNTYTLTFTGNFNNGTLVHTTTAIMTVRK